MMPVIGCQYAPLADLALDDTSWLSPDELRRWQLMHSAERRATWLAGRTLAKRMLCAELGSIVPGNIHIESQSANAGHGERPQVFVDGVATDASLSIAHTSRGVLVALSADAGIRLGVDLVCRDAPREPLIWTFTAAERRWLVEEQGRSAERVWAMKEALYKACQQGEGFAPARIEVVGELRYPALGTGFQIARMQSWRVDGQVAALAVVINKCATPRAFHFTNRSLAPGARGTRAA